MKTRFDLLFCVRELKWNVTFFWRAGKLAWLFLAVAENFSPGSAIVACVILPTFAAFVNREPLSSVQPEREGFHHKIMSSVIAILLLFDVPIHCLIIEGTTMRPGFKRLDGKAITCDVTSKSNFPCPNLILIPSSRRLDPLDPQSNLPSLLWYKCLD